MCNCDSKRHCGKCIDEYTIRSLPFTIAKPGQYCLCRDFTWTDPNQSAITILNTENVVLNFNQRKITSTVSSTFPIVFVQNSNDVVLNDIHLNAIEGGRFLSAGLYISSSRVVTVNRPVLLNLVGTGIGNALNGKFAFRALDVKDLKINDLSLENMFDNYVNAGSNFRANVLIQASCNVVIEDASMKQGQMQVYDSENVDILRLQSNVSRIIAGVCLVIISRLSTETPSRQTRNIRLADSNLRGSDLFSAGAAVLVRGDRRNQFPSVQNFIIENNTVVVATGIAFWIDEFNTAFTIRNNQVVLGDVQVEVDPLLDYADGIDVVNCYSGTIDNNNIASAQNVITFNIGIALFSDDDANIPTKLGKYMTVKENFVSNCLLYGYTDNEFDLGFPDPAFCSVFKDNVALGNGINYNFLEPSTISVNNIEGCNNPEPLAAVAKRQERKIVRTEEELLEKIQKRMNIDI